MDEADRQTRSRLMRLFEQQGKQPRHDLGQNFLVDLNLHQLIVKHAALSTADVVLEVGTGTGGLTAQLADHAGHVISVEFDEHVYGHAKHLLAGRNNVTLIHGDALANKSTLAPEVITAIEQSLVKVRAAEQRNYGGLGDAVTDADNPWLMQPAVTTLKLVANLPYNIATPVMSNLIAGDWPWSKMVVTIQYELAERMLAKPGTGDYSALTVWMQSQAELKLIRKLPPGVFWPPPKVDSAVLRVDRSPQLQQQIEQRDWFHAFVRDVFTLRRKQILGVLTQQFSEKTVAERTAHHSAPQPVYTREALSDVLGALQIAPTARPEQLSVAQFVALSNRLAPQPTLTAKA
ncbi:ribosomal RNA small subunit methyltransferase A [bacterium]|nr:ribosomal RNA small subunit methyltransferase A [bacterium]